MRPSEEIKREAEELELPDPEHKALMLVLEVFLDIRGLLDSIDTWAAHTEGHAERIAGGRQS